MPTSKWRLFSLQERDQIDKAGARTVRIKDASTPKGSHCGLESFTFCGTLPWTGHDKTHAPKLKGKPMSLINSPIPSSVVPSRFGTKAQAEWNRGTHRDILFWT